MREAEARTIISLVDMDQRKAGYFQMRERDYAGAQRLGR